MKRKTVMTILSVIAAGMMVFSPVTAKAAGIEEAGQNADSSELTLDDFVDDTQIVLIRGNPLDNHVLVVSGSANCQVVCGTVICDLILEQNNREGNRYTYDCRNYGTAKEHALAANTTCEGMVDTGAGPVEHM